MKKKYLNSKKKIKLPNNYALIHSQAKKTFMKNKDWGQKKSKK